MGAAGDGLEPRSRRRERQSFHRSTGRRGDRVFNIHIVPSAHPPSSSITRTPFAPPGKDVEWAGRAAAACELSHISPTLCLFLKVVKFMRVGGGFASPLIFARKACRQVYQSVTRTGLEVRLLGFGFQQVRMRLVRPKRQSEVATSHPSPLLRTAVSSRCMLHGPRFHARMRHAAEQARHGHGEWSRFCRLNGFVAPPLRHVTSVLYQQA